MRESEANARKKLKPHSLDMSLLIRITEESLQTFKPSQWKAVFLVFAGASFGRRM